MADNTKGKTLWGGHLKAQPSADNVAYCAGRDVVPLPEADRELLPSDVWGSSAHVLMLHKAGILNRKEAGALLKGLDSILKRFQEGRFVFDPAREDVHTHIEDALRETCGQETAGKVHTARSRNDQAMCATRLWLRDAVLLMHAGISGLIRCLLKKARENAGTIMPGITHRQHGTISTLGHLLVAHAQAMLRDLDRLEATYVRINRNPLGAAAGYGTSWPIDRALTASYLGFDGLQRNALDAVGSRWEAEADLVGALSFFMTHAAQLSADLIFLSSPAVKAVTLPDEYVTGSSIMPQKRNPDFAEVTLGKAAMIKGYLFSLLGIPHGQISGYNREFQLTKYMVFDALREVRDAPDILSQAIGKTLVNRARLLEMSGEGFLNAVDFADFLASECGLSFREAHGVVARAVGRSGKAGYIELEAINEELKNEKTGRVLTRAEYDSLSNPEENLARRKSAGSPNPTEVLATLDECRETLSEREKWLKEKSGEIRSARARTQKTAERLMKG